VAVDPACLFHRRKVFPYRFGDKFTGDPERAVDTWNLDLAG